MSSATPVTVTVCSVSQFPVVNVSAPDTVAAAVSLLFGVTVTEAVGLVASFAVYVLVLDAPVSDTVSVSAERTTPASSPSVTVTVIAATPSSL